MVVIDTNVLVHLLIDGDRTTEARRLFTRDSDWRSEPFALIEFTNVLATAVRVRGLARGTADDLLSAANEVLRLGSHPVPHATALELAHRYSISSYDARFLAVAIELDTRLVTEDARLRRAVPDLAISLTDVLADA